MKHRILRRFLAGTGLALAGSALLAVAGCDSSFYAALGNKVAVTRLAMAPAAATVPVNGTITFSASGGAPPYTFSMVSGFGTINASTGAYVAGATAGSEVVQVQDKQGTTSQASVTVTSTAGPLAITPSTVSLNVGGNLTFIATGGTPPYTFSIQTAGSAPPAPAINSSTGAYTAGSTVGTDTIKVTDAAAATSTATVNVTSAATSVDYRIPAETLPASGVGGTALPGGYSFTIQNGGTANGSQPITWWVFLSTTPTPGSGTVLLESGTAAALAANPASTVIPLSWTWPTVPPVLPGQTRYLYLMISAADDLTTANNTYTSPSLVVAPPNIDYTVASVSSTGGTQAGTPINGSFTLQNSGTAAGSANVSWTAYVSPNGGATIDAGADVIDSGSTGSLPGSGSTAVPFTGTWPAGSGTYYLKVAISAADEVNTTNDVQVSPSYLTTNVDYAVTAVNNTGGLVAGAGLAGNFTVANSGTANGTQAINWEVYASTTGTLAGSTLLASGTTAALNVGQSTPVSFSGTWPSTAGSYYLIAKADAADDTVTGNNQLSSGVLTVSPASVDYAVTAVAVTGGSTNPAGAMTGSLQFTNNGPNAGTQYVTWQVYASKVTVLDGTAVLLASGSYAPLAALASSSTIGFSGTWPLAYGNYYLIARVTVPVDVDTSTANNTMATAGTTAVGFYAEAEPNSDPAFVSSTPNVLPITLQPGMSISVSGNMNPTDTYDIFQFNTGTASSVTFAWNWGSSGNANMYVMSGASTSITGVGITGAKSLSMLWSPVDFANTTRYVALNNASGASLGGWTLIITAN